MSSASLWATDIRHLNDASEFAYAKQLARQKFKDILTRVQSEPHVGALKGAIDAVHQLRPTVFAASLTAGDDLLSQWRAYGKPGDACAISFSRDVLQRVARRRGWKLGPVVYSPGAQWDHLNHFEIEAARQAGPDPKQFARRYCERLLLLGPFLKDPSFREEGEWRLAAYAKPRKSLDIEYRRGLSMIVPYVRLRLSNGQRPPPILKILVGPGPHPDLDREAVETFCSARGIAATIGNSDIPYRAW